MTLTLTINLGNPTTLTQEDAGRLVSLVGHRLVTRDIDLSNPNSWCSIGGPVFDADGNKAGTWRYYQTAQCPTFRETAQAEAIIQAMLEARTGKPQGANYNPHRRLEYSDELGMFIVRDTANGPWIALTADQATRINGYAPAAGYPSPSAEIRAFAEAVR